MASDRQPRSSSPTNSSRLQSAICDYEGSSYRTQFWTKDRSYEDAVERIALRALLPPVGHRLLDIGAGFGRMVDLYAGYDQVILFDYSRSMLKEAYAQWGDRAPAGRPHYIYVAGDFNALPFVIGLFDTATMIRVIHHAPDVPQVLYGVNEVLAPSGTFVLEFANKRNLKAIGRWILQKQKWSPFDRQPIEFAELNYNFHPHWIHTQLKHAGFAVQAQRSVSHFRLRLLKRLVTSQLLTKLDSLMQPTGRWWKLTPSVFVKSRVTPARAAAREGAFFRCPICRSPKISEQSDALVCQSCQRAWSIHDGLYDFKKPV